MLRSLIAPLSFLLLALALTVLSTPRTANAEMPFEGWLSFAADSLDQQIDEQVKLSWKSFQSISQCAAENFDHMLDQCRMGVAGSRGRQLVRLIDL